MRPFLRFLALAAMLAPPAMAAAQDAGNTSAARRAPAIAGPAGRSVQLRVGGARFDNFFQAPDGRPTRDMQAGTADLRVVHALGAGGRSSVRARGGVTAFEGLPTAAVAEVGARAAGRRQLLDVLVGTSLNSPRFEVGDALERADAVGATVEYGVLLTPALQVGAIVDASRERYEHVHRNDNTVWDAGGSLRWRGFGSTFSPEVGALWGHRAVENAQESFDQRTVYVQLRSAPWRGTYASARFRRRLREYVTGDATAANRGREDTRDQLTAGVTLTPRIGPAWDVYYALDDVRSSRAGRDFRAHGLSLGATFRLWRW